MLTSIFPWLLLIDERNTNDDGMVRTWGTVGVGNVVKRIKLTERPRWARWSYAAGRERHNYLMAGGLWWERT